MQSFAKVCGGIAFTEVHQGGKMRRIAIVGLTVLLMATRAIAQTVVPGPAPTPTPAQPSPRTQPTHDQLMAFAKAAFGPRGRNLSYREAGHELSKMRVGMDAAITLLATCAPTRSGGYNVIWPKADALPLEQMHCSIGGSDEPLDKIKSLLADNQIVNLSYTSTPTPTGGVRINQAIFMIFSVGMAGSGVSTSIEFQPDYPDCSTHIQKDEGTYAAVRALNRPSCTWLWEHDEE